MGMLRIVEDVWKKNNPFLSCKSGYSNGDQYPFCAHRPLKHFYVSEINTVHRIKISQTLKNIYVNT